MYHPLQAKVVAVTSSGHTNLNKTGLLLSRGLWFYAWIVGGRMDK